MYMKKNVVSNEQGMALVTAMLILVALTLIAVTAVTNTTIDTKIVGNEYWGSERLYASAGCVETARATLSAIVSGTPIPLPDGTTAKIDNISDLLNYEKNHGSVTSLVNAVLGDQSLNEICNPAQQTARTSFNVQVVDNYEKREDPVDPYTDTDGKFQLLSTAIITKPDGSQRLINQVKETVIQASRLFKGVVNLLNPDQAGDPTYSNTEIVFGGSAGSVEPGAWQGTITGSSNDHVAGVITTDNIANITNYPSTQDGELQVSPSGVKVDSAFDPGTIGNLEKFVDKLKVNHPDPDMVGENIVINSGTLLGTLANPKVAYLKGSVSIGGDVQGAGILIIEDYYNGSDSSGQPYHCGLVMKDVAKYHGLIILLPRSTNYSGRIDVSLHNGAQVDGAVMAASTYQSDGKLAIKFEITGNAKCSYDPTNFQNVLPTNDYQVVGWDYHF
jgi:hypothetical protein